MDHTPGQRQWRNTDAYRTYYSTIRSWTEEEFASNVAELQERQRTYTPLHTGMVTEFCTAHGVPMASHDDTTVEDVNLALGHGIVISEFPTTIEAARHARNNGMTVLMGSPNVVRGKSHSGNISALDVAHEGLLERTFVRLCTHESAARRFVLQREAGLSLPDAVSMVTRRPAPGRGPDGQGRTASRAQGPTLYAWPCTMICR